MSPEPPSESWYEVCSGEGLLQGDLIPSCPVIEPLSLGAQAGQQASVDLVDVDLVVLSQSCDLEAKKIDVVLGAAYRDWHTLKTAELGRGNSYLGTESFRKKLVSGDIPGLFLLNRFDGALLLPWSIVDFRRPYVVPLSVMAEHAAQSGERLRMISPYREHLAQAFARYVMRVGLPIGPKAFVSEGA